MIFLDASVLAHELLEEKIDTMAVELSELRPGDYEQVVELWQEAGADGLSMEDMTALACGQSPFDSVISLIARDGGKLVAAILCRYDKQQGYLYSLAILEPYRNNETVKMMVDKSLLKLSARGVHKCRIPLDDPDPQAPFWHTVSWFEKQKQDAPPPSNQPASASP